MEDRIEEAKPKSKAVEVSWKNGRGVKKVTVILWTNGILRRETNQYPSANVVYPDLQALLEDLGHDSSYSELRGAGGPALIREICEKHKQMLIPNA